LLPIQLFDRNLVSGMVKSWTLPDGVLGISVSPYHGMGASDVAAIPSLRRRSTFSIGIWTRSRHAAAGQTIQLNLMLVTSDTERTWHDRLTVTLPSTPGQQHPTTPKQRSQAAALRRTLPEGPGNRPTRTIRPPGVSVQPAAPSTAPTPSATVKAEDVRAKHRRPRDGFLRSLLAKLRADAKPG
jgi:hypothetical protein